MENKKIRLQDIADKLNISRNTVSKALNNTGVISEETKNKVLQTAIEMGYKQFSYIQANSSSKEYLKNKEIALFTSNMPTGSHFGSNCLSGFEKKISTYGIKLSIYLIRDSDLQNLTLPNSFNPDLVDGILCIEMLDKDYSNLICSLNLPTLFVDCSPIKDNTNLAADIILMENFSSVYNLTKYLLNNNITNIGFIGDNTHCQSFYERWQGYTTALLDHGIPFILDNSILENDKSPYGNSSWLIEKLKKLPSFPQAFVCANDFIAITLINALRELNYSIPKDIIVCGFDDCMESKIIDPKLTTVSIASSEMGESAAKILLNRIKNVDSSFSITHVKTSIIYRDSTNFIV